MAGERLKTYQEFWPFYLGEHRRTLTRAFHVVGTTLGLSMGVTAILLGNPWLGLSAIICAYGFAWVSHFFIEHNRPATFRYPFWSLISDFRMLALAYSFSLSRELRRQGISTP